MTSLEYCSNNNPVIGPRILTNLKFLKRLSRSVSDTGRWRLLRKASGDELLSLVEVCTNVLRPHCFNLSRRQKDRLLPFAPTIRQLGRTRSEGGARRITIQKGSGPLFAALLVPIIAEASRYLISSIANGGGGD